MLQKRLWLLSTFSFKSNHFVCECKGCVEKEKIILAEALKTKITSHIFPLGRLFTSLAIKKKHVKKILAPWNQRGGRKRAGSPPKSTRTELKTWNAMFWSALPTKSSTVCCQTRDTKVGSAACLAASSWQCSLIAISPCVMPRLSCHVKLHRCVTKWMRNLACQAHHSNLHGHTFWTKTPQKKVSIGKLLRFLVRHRTLIAFLTSLVSSPEWNQNFHEKQTRWEKKVNQPQKPFQKPVL